MKHYGVEIKWGVIFSVVALLWMMMEKSLGWHDEHIDKHAIYTNLFAIPAILLYVFALIDKRNNYYGGRMTYMQGLVSGIIVSVVVAVLSPLVQYITLQYVTPDFFTNIRDYAVKIGRMTEEQAAAYFRLKSYLIQSVIGALAMGIVTSAIVAFFVKKEAVSLL